MKNFKVLKLTLGVAFLTILTYNVVIALEEKYKAIGDPWDYIHLGLSIAKTGQYGHFEASREQLVTDFKENRIEDKQYIFKGQTAFRPPVWPLLIASVFVIFGYNLTLVVIFKFLLHLIGSFIFYKILRLLKVHEVLLIIGTFFYAINPAWQLYSRVFLSEPITFFFLTLWLYFLIRYLQKSKGFFSQAIVAGILILSHPYYLFLPFSVWLFLHILKKFKFTKLLLSSTIALLIIFLWIIRNSLILKTDEVVLTTSSGAVMAKGWNSNVIQEHTNTRGDLANEELVLNNFDYDRSLVYHEVEKMKLYKDATLNFVTNNPDLVLPIILRKLKSAFNPFPETPKPGMLETGRWLFQFLALIALTYILVLSKNRMIKAFALGLVFSTIGITIVIYSGFRFRMPQVGLELLFIVFAIDDFRKRRRSFQGVEVKN